MSSGGGGGGGVPADTTNVHTIREAPEIEARRLGLMDAAVELAKKKTGVKIKKKPSLGDLKK